MAETTKLKMGKKLEEFVSTFDKASGGMLSRAQKDPRREAPRLPSGFFSLDRIIRGGFRGGSYVEFYGQESVGKSYLALTLAAQCQQLWQQPVAYLDFEGTWDGERAEELGVSLDPDAFLLLNFPDMEDAYNSLQGALRKQVFGLIVIDSLNGMPVRYETENKIENQTMAYQARIHSKGLRMITPFLNDALIIMINQLRESMQQYVPFTTAGGRAIKHYDHMRLEMKKERRREEVEAWDHQKLAWEAKEKVTTGHYINGRLEKNKIGRPETSCRLVFDYDMGGVDRTEDVLGYLVEREVITRSGNFFATPDGKKHNGRKKLHAYVTKNFEHFEKLAREELSAEVNGT